VQTLPQPFPNHWGPTTHLDNMKERLWYAPGSFAGVPHWELQLRTMTGEWRTYTEHQTKEAARAHWQRLCSRWPKQEARYVGLNVSFSQYAPVPASIPLGFA
jgi:hypothetical protein